ncbi:MAG TPA: hypothetical protein PLI51_02530 [bacterium]|nr:hypothetical protein [bacterium]HPQ65592.1 hypothetical protein [bacterium]
MNPDPAARTTDLLIDFWKLHRGLDANMKSLAAHCGVSRDTVYRWLNRRALPRDEKVDLVIEWLRRRGASA